MTIEQLIERSPDEFYSRALVTRTINALRSVGFASALDLCRLDPDELRELPGIGTQAALALVHSLEAAGFHMRPGELGAPDARYALVLEDWAAGVPTKETASKLGLSSSRVVQLRPKAKRDRLARERWPNVLARYDAQFEG